MGWAETLPAASTGIPFSLVNSLLSRIPGGMDYGPYESFNALAPSLEPTESGGTDMEAIGGLTGGGSSGSFGLGNIVQTGVNVGSSYLNSRAASGSAQDSAVAALNTYEAALKKVKDDYLAGPASLSQQNQALAIVDQGLAWLTSTQGLGNPALGSWGSNGLADRLKGGKYSWYAGFRDPIANDPRLGNPVTSIIGEAQAALGLSMTGMLLIVAVVGGLLYWRYR